ncbi:hypothetical protein [Massilia glaciei]|uniref:Uracil-DNA glycosylase-like domain-containing protein n=1 Tax=Massilia glaciei TaxID=1524097 RepID=A0A2U2I7C4_9BURK|nr:hypothetical protein [Massilia glaciei]PWF55615.1 hypothetical protein C7C56_000900 [Massilia glaciei]
MSMTLSRATLASVLFDEMTVVEPFPAGVAAVPAMAPGTSFFPGGGGLWCEGESEIFPDVLVLGHDFSTKEEHDRFLLGTDRDIDSATWRELIKLAKNAGLDLNRCFFTNAFMGLRTVGNSTAINPAHKNVDFRKINAAFLKQQIAIIRPKLIIVLGSKAPILLSQVSDDLGCWRKFNFAEIDEAGLAFRRNVKLEAMNLICVAILHTSFRGPNLRLRKYGDLTGNLAEVALLQDALREVDAV